MAIGHRLNGHTQLEQRLERLELVAGTSTEELERGAFAWQVWEGLPEGLRRFFNGVDWEGRGWHGWYDLRELVRVAMDRVVDGQDPLVPVAGWVVRQAWHKLAWWHVRARGGNCLGGDLGWPAAEELLGISESELDRL
jgi:hypothetical protein